MTQVWILAIALVIALPAAVFSGETAVVFDVRSSFAKAMKRNILDIQVDLWRSST